MMPRPAGEMAVRPRRPGPRLREPAKLVAHVPARLPESRRQQTDIERAIRPYDRVPIAGVRGPKGRREDDPLRGSDGVPQPAPRPFLESRRRRDEPAIDR